MRAYTSSLESIKGVGEVSALELLRQFGVRILDHSSQHHLEMEKIDAIILSAQDQDPQSAYIIALALSQKKPILCLVPKGQRLPESFSLLKNNRALAKHLHTCFYTPINLKEGIYKFLQKIEGAERKETPSVKFTLRITPSMERYLLWKSKKTGLSKADFLRQAIKESIIEPDSEYSKK